uniref:Uncharacterized protein n=1 Tax=Ascaris lumbricoides TaxID=6252 RepID=A0A0M3IL72_ASCLU
MDAKLVCVVHRLHRNYNSTHLLLLIHRSFKAIFINGCRIYLNKFFRLGRFISFFGYR